MSSPVVWAAITYAQRASRGSKHTHRGLLYSPAIALLFIVLRFNLCSVCQLGTVVENIHRPWSRPPQQEAEIHDPHVVSIALQADDLQSWRQGASEPPSSAGTVPCRIHDIIVALI